MEKVKVVFSKAAFEVYKQLVESAKHSKVDRSILRAINHKKELIKLDKHYGQPIKRRLIPKEYKNHGIRSMFRVGLPNFWRMHYTLGDDENMVEIVAFVIDIVDHKDYNKILGY
ncbi:MAG: hypothetical protein GOV02_02735 [Candidatus Aenigmarchaeota archaeon]|nr:hypothetical protein [Candidatus Aenigmarchaeota archaeon]